METNKGTHINSESNTLTIQNEGQNEGRTNEHITVTEPKKYCGVFSKTGLIFFVVIIIIIIAVAVTVPILISNKNKLNAFDEDGNDSAVVIQAPTMQPTRPGDTLPPTKNVPTKSPEEQIMVNWNTNQVGGGYSANAYVLGGIDFVQYSLNGVSKPVLGVKDSNGNFIYTNKYLAGNFAFASQANLDIFLTDSARYAPRYGGYGILNILQHIQCILN